MKDVSFSDQYKHPLWQKKRLEMLDHANFECTNCGCNEKQLHIHHKQYFKGRNIWDYEFHELEALCGDCHKTFHEHLAFTKKVISNSYPITDSSLFRGFYQNIEDLIEDFSQPKEFDGLAKAAGFIAYLSYGTGDIDKMYKVAEFAASLLRIDCEEKMRFDHQKDYFGR